MKAELEALIQQMIASGILFEEAVREFERNFIVQVVQRNGENLSKAALELGIHRNTLTKRLQEYQTTANTAEVITENPFTPPRARNKALRRQVAPRRKTRLASLTS